MTDDVFTGLRRQLVELRDQVETTERKLDASILEVRRLRAYLHRIRVHSRSTVARELVRQARTTTLWPNRAAPAASSKSRGPAKDDDE